MKIHFNNAYLDIIPTDESYRYRQIMGDHSLTLYFSLSEHTEIPTGATCEFQGETYILNLPAKIVKQNNFHFDYTLTMDSEGAKLKQLKFKNPNDHSLKFPLTATPEQHLQMLIEVLNSAPTGGVWQMGQCISGTEKLISYNHNSCAEALQMIAQAFETEYEIKGKTIHLQKVEHFKDDPLPLSYGKGNGFKSGVGRVTQQSRITRLFVQGSDRNIDRYKYGSKALLLPKNQEYTFDGTTYISDHQGFSVSIKNASNNGFINEQSLDLSHIYPKRQGTISQVFEVNPDKNFYDFTDETIPADCDFSALQIKGEKMVVYFESGMLSGREFEIQKYKHSQKRFELVSKEEDGTTMPNAIFKPAMGDQYAVFNMQMPDSYICDNTTQTGASWEMMKQACKYFSENQDDIFSFQGELDGIWAKKNWTNVGGKLVLGGYIHFSDTQFQPEPIAIRIIGLKEHVNNPHSPQIELSNKIQSGGFLSEIRKISNQEVKFEDLNRQAISFTKRRWRDTQETISQIEGAMSHFGKSINPATIQTMMTLIGDKSLQFEFVQSKQNPVRVPHWLYFDKETKQLHAGGGWLKHHTLGINEIKPNRSHEEYKYWLLSPFVSGRLDDADKKYYLYAKVSQSQEVGSFWLSQHPIELEQEAGYYHLLVGTLNSEYQGDRGFARLYGFTEILPGQMKIDKISSGDGQQFIEFLPDRININAHVTFTDGSPAFNQLKKAVSPDLLSLENRLKAFSEQKVNNVQIGDRNFILNSKNPIRKKGRYVEYSLSQTLERGEYTASFDVEIIHDVGYLGVIPARKGKHSPYPVVFLPTRGNGRYAFKVTITGDDVDAFTLYPQRGYATETYGVMGEAIFSNVALKKGNNSDWTPAPEDMMSIINQSKSAMEQYAQSQSELAKNLAIANADGKISQAEQRQINNAIQKLQEAKNFAQQKINELQIGARNLFLKSNKLKQNKQLLLSRNVQTDINYSAIDIHYTGGEKGIAFHSNTIGGYVEFDLSVFLSEPLKTQQEYIFSMDLYTGGFFSIEFLNQDNLVISQQIRGHGGFFKRFFWTFSLPSSVNKMRFKNNDSNHYWVVDNLALYLGNKNYDWTPAPEDIETDVQHAKAWADMLNQAEKENIKKISEIFQKQNDFVSGTNVVKNTITTGALMVGNHLGGNSGLNGSGLRTDEVRMWAGASFDNRQNAPFRVLDNGEIYVSKLKAMQGCKIGDFEITQSGLSYNPFHNSNQGAYLNYDNLIFRGSRDKCFNRIGTQVFSVSSGMYCYSFIQDVDDYYSVGAVICLGEELERVPIIGSGGSIGQYINNLSGTALHLNSGRGTALKIEKGSVVVEGEKGINDNVWVGRLRNGKQRHLKVRKGIIVGVIDE